MAKKSIPRKKTQPRQTRTQEDIIELILQDHKPLKKLIRVLKSSRKEFAEKGPAFQEFAPLLISHAKPEEHSLYISMKKDGELRSEAFEGDTEHSLADQLVEEIKRTDDEDVWMAKVKVLAELVEHHIEEEEEDMLPNYKKETALNERVEVGQLYMRLRQVMLKQGGDDAPSEKKLRGRKMEPMQMPLD